MAYARWIDKDTALDVVQETFLRLWKQLEKPEDLQNPRGWLLRVARNLAEDIAKSAFRRHGTQAQEVMGGLTVEPMTPLDRMAQTEFHEQIRNLLQELATGDREILTLRYALDYDTTRIAGLLNTTVTAVHMRLSRARERLAERLAAHGVTQRS